MNTDDQGKVIENSSLHVNNTKCPNCGSIEFEMRNYSMMWHEGDIHCANCGQFIRYYDAG
jgi:transcription elongation factor Elf1